MRSLKRTPTTFILSLGLCLFPPFLVAQEFDNSSSQYAGDRRHDDPQWLSVQQHLPNLATAPPATLEQEGDLLRVRRFPEDALQYYAAAVKRGGCTADLMNKIGLLQLELRNVLMAQGYFRQAIRVDRTNGQGWNNLAATEYLERNYGAAVSDYKRAVKLSKTNAIFHANLSTAYFETKNYKGGRREADEALRLDPLVFQRSSGSGMAAHVLTLEDRARFAFEMAKLYAQHGQQEEMLHSLAIASENGFDIMGNMAKDPSLSRYRDDPRVILLVMTAKALRLGNSSTVTAAAAVPKLDPLVEGR